MPSEELTREEALLLITTVVDGEATPKEQYRFDQCLSKYPDVLREYHPARAIKTLLQQRCPREKSTDRTLRTDTAAYCGRWCRTWRTALGPVV